MNISVLMRIIRGLDGIFLTSFLAVILIVHPSLGRNEMGLPTIICVVPIFIIAGYAHRLPFKLDSIRNWREIILKLRLFTLTFACFSPFIIWWNKIPGNIYLLVNSQLAVFAGIGLLFNLNRLLLELTIFTGCKTMEWELKLTKIMIFYSMLVPFVALLVTYSIDSFISSDNSFMDFHTILTFIPHWLRVVIMAPVLLCLSLLFRVRYFLVRQFDDQIRETYA